MSYLPGGRRRPYSRRMREYEDPYGERGQRDSENETLGNRPNEFDDVTFHDTDFL